MIRQVIHWAIVLLALGFIAKHPTQTAGALTSLGDGIGNLVTGLMTAAAALVSHSGK